VPDTAQERPDPCLGDDGVGARRPHPEVFAAASSFAPVLQLVLEQLGRVAGVCLIRAWWIARRSALVHGIALQLLEPFLTSVRNGRFRPGRATKAAASIDARSAR
jgi:hypothetical protein